MSLYLEHFGMREPPFRITPHTDFFFTGANRGPTLDALISASQRCPAARPARCAPRGCWPWAGRRGTAPA